VSLFSTTDDDRGKRGILVKPKKKEGEDPLFVEVKLFLRDQDYLPYRIHVMNDKDSEVDIDVREYKVNDKLDSAKLQIAVPEGTKVVEDDEVLETVGPGGKTYPEGLPKAEVPVEETKPSVEVKELSPPSALIEAPKKP
jgi:hypothetical protein